jgi:hypothetical protein
VRKQTKTKVQIADAAARKALRAAQAFYKTLGTAADLQAFAHNLQAICTDKVRVVLCNFSCDVTQSIDAARLLLPTDAGTDLQHAQALAQHLTQQGTPTAVDADTVFQVQQLD